ncbi:hypothetical protein HDU76_001407, partial [Blyttiomyces sp. JEL0837]
MNGVVDLSDLDLTDIPKVVYDLKHMVSAAPNLSISSDVKLFLSSNRLESIPVKLCELTNLTVLTLRKNRLREIPPEIRLLVNLLELSVGNNELTHLPGEISKLSPSLKLHAFPNPFYSSASFVTFETEDGRIASIYSDIANSNNNNSNAITLIVQQNQQQPRNANPANDNHHDSTAPGSDIRIPHSPPSLVELAERASIRVLTLVKTRPLSFYSDSDTVITTCISSKSGFVTPLSSLPSSPARH